jgi:predicted O-methyltransferase YrrM
MEDGIEYEVKDGIALTKINGVTALLNFGDVQVLKHHAKNLGPNAKYVETGSYLGGSTMIISKFSAATLWAHDIWLEPHPDLKDAGPAGPNEHMFYRFYDVVKSNNLQNRVIPIRGDSAYTLGIHDPESIDLAFVDGDHTYEGALKDFRMIYPRMKKGGIILAHDCVPASPALHAIETFATENGLRIELFPHTTGLARVIIP